MVLLQPPWFGELTLNLGLTLRLRGYLGRRTDGRILANSVAVAGVGAPRDVFKRDESWGRLRRNVRGGRAGNPGQRSRSEEHTSELQSRLHLVCRLLLDKKKRN